MNLAEEMLGHALQDMNDDEMPPKWKNLAAFGHHELLYLPNFMGKFNGQQWTNARHSTSSAIVSAENEWEPIVHVIECLLLY